MQLDEVKIIQTGIKRHYKIENDIKWDYIILANEYIYNDIKAKWKDIIITNETHIDNIMFICFSGSIKDQDLSRILGHPYPNTYIYNITLVYVPNDMDYHRFLHENYIIYRMIKIHDLETDLSLQIESSLGEMITYIDSKGIYIPYMAIYIYVINCTRKGYSVSKMKDLIYMKNLYYCSMYSYGYEFVKDMKDSDWLEIKNSI